MVSAQWDYTVPFSRIIDETDKKYTWRFKHYYYAYVNWIIIIYWWLLTLINLDGGTMRSFISYRKWWNTNWLWSSLLVNVLKLDRINNLLVYTLLRYILYDLHNKNLNTSGIKSQICDVISFVSYYASSN